MEKLSSGTTQQVKNTPRSIRISKMDLHLKKLINMNVPLPVQNFKTFVVGICGGDCAGKREMIQYMFDKSGQQWMIKGSNQHVTILSQTYFITATNGLKYSSKGTNWQNFNKNLISLLIGNQVDITYNHDDVKQKIHLKPAKLLVIEGSHIFMSPEVTIHLPYLINLKIFIDSDSDVRLSRRVYQDTEQKKISLNQSIANYLQYIKPSYQREIQATKQTSDIIIPHFGGGFNDHKKDDKQKYDSNIKNACHLILTHLRQQMKKYEQQMILLENQA